MRSGAVGAMIRARFRAIALSQDIAAIPRRPVSLRHAARHPVRGRQVVDVPALVAACTHPCCNQTPCRVNASSCASAWCTLAQARRRGRVLPRGERTLAHRPRGPRRGPGAGAGHRRGEGRDASRASERAVIRMVEVSAIVPTGDGRVGRRLTSGRVRSRVDRVLGCPGPSAPWRFHAPGSCARSRRDVRRRRRRRHGACRRARRRPSPPPCRPDRRHRLPVQPSGASAT